MASSFITSLGVFLTPGADVYLSSKLLAKWRTFNVTGLYIGRDYKDNEECDMIEYREVAPDGMEKYGQFSRDPNKGEVPAELVLACDIWHKSFSQTMSLPDFLKKTLGE